MDSSDDGGDDIDCDGANDLYREVGDWTTVGKEADNGAADDGDDEIKINDTDGANDTDKAGAND